MEQLKRVQVISIIAGIIAILFGFWLFEMFQLSESLYEKILSFLLGYFAFYIGIYAIFNKIIEKYKVLSVVYNKILSIPIIFVFKIQYVAAPVLSTIIFIALYFTPSVMILKISDFFPYITPYVEGIIYLVSLISVLLFAYKGNKVMAFIIESFRTIFAKGMLHRFSSSYFTRVISYILMILIYVIYNFDYFSRNTIIGFVPDELLTVIKEVFVTFVAIDSLIQIIANKKE